jgi:hypothetical protein
MPADRAVLEASDLQPALASQSGLDWPNFFLARVLTGFGPFVAVYGSTSPANIGRALPSDLSSPSRALPD